MTTDSGPASENGVPLADAPAHDEQQPQDKTVPYARFAEVNQAKKAAETALAEVVAQLVEDLPDNMRGLVPELPAAQKIAWLRQAKVAGLFTPSAPQNSPDPKRPSGKTSQDLNGLSPVQMMQMGYRQ